jgi:serine/threonine-protein kinase RsbW
MTSTKIEVLALSFKNHVPELIRAMQQVEDFLTARDLPPQAIYAANLTIEEMGTNIIKYSYDDPAKHTIGLKVELHPRQVVVHLIDDGHEFNPITAPEPDVNQNLADREPGGLGICLIRKMTDGLEYRRQDGKNHLTVFIDRSGADSGERHS